MLNALKRSQEQLAAFERVREWTRAHFALPTNATILVSELACGLPGCPPLETVIVFWTDADKRHHFKVFKPVEEVALEDFPPAWLKNALVAIPGIDCDCC
jgi:nitrate reductase delta subunit